MGDHDVDLFVIGAGSGGVRAARMAASYGARVAVAEVAARGAEYDWHRDPQEPIFYPAQAAVPSAPA